MLYFSLYHNRQYYQVIIFITGRRLYHRATSNNANRRYT